MSSTIFPTPARPNTPSSDTADDVLSWGNRLKVAIEAEIRKAAEELGDAALARIVILQELEIITKDMRREKRSNAIKDEEFDFEAANESVERLEYLTEQFSRHSDEFCEEVLAFKAAMDAAEAELEGGNEVCVEVLVSHTTTTTTTRRLGADA
ncbi:hypothetical protein P691DRAFT_780074 [Macrolepiota fuliginosa MF-IS2]|uniref:Uncharacterized protein n=1 Tax=Macrolepiota fuliginosa MF-IS2 TaxID=1400762 RepID=A0A9P6BWH8_9AGAR|nr:hypothetical protein P691DRAFT_780074 [Macrolepiota fuliginosa MF-IS2]